MTWCDMYTARTEALSVVETGRDRVTWCDMYTARTEALSVVERQEELELDRRNTERM